MVTLNQTDMLAERLSEGLSILRRWGFRVTQNRQAATQPLDQQRERAHIAACYMLGIEPLPEHFEWESVDKVARALLGNTHAPIDIPATWDGNDGAARLTVLRHLLDTELNAILEGSAQGAL